MLKFIDKIRARKECADKGHVWEDAGMGWDFDGGMGGGRQVRKLRCARCGASACSMFESTNTTMTKETADA